MNIARSKKEVGFERFLTTGEYLFSSIGVTGKRVDPCYVTFVLEGDGPEFDARRWQQALDQASRRNTGSRLRMAGWLWRCRWISDGAGPVVRVVDHTQWDLMSDRGSDFIDAVPLPLDRGPTVELILVNNSPRGRLVILRTLHAVMDGRGAQFFLAEIFRAMRNEPLVGSAIQLDKRKLREPTSSIKRPPPDAPTTWLTGSPTGDETGSEWRRFSIEAGGANILGRVAAALAEWMHGHSDKAALFMVPVDLRRHTPGCTSTANFTGQIRVPFKKGETADDFRQRLRSMLEDRLDLYFPRGHGLVKAMPRRLIEHLLVKAVFGRKKPGATAVLTNMGRMSPQDFSCAEFAVRSGFAVPLPGVILVAMVGMGPNLELTITLPKVFGSNGRFDRLSAHLTRRLTGSRERPQIVHHARSAESRFQDRP